MSGNWNLIKLSSQGTNYSYMLDVSGLAHLGPDWRIFQAACVQHIIIPKHLNRSLYHDILVFLRNFTVQVQEHDYWKQQELLGHLF
jgi:hypothetical protein